MSTEQPGPNEMFCASCGEVIKEEAEVCPHCGVRQTSEEPTDSETPEKDAGIAAILSLLIPGAGDIYNGEVGRGAIVFVIYLVVWGLWSAVLLTITVVTLGIGFFVWILWPLPLLANPASAYLSYQRTQRINAGEIQV